VADRHRRSLYWLHGEKHCLPRADVQGGANSHAGGASIDLRAHQRAAGIISPGNRCGRTCRGSARWIGLYASRKFSTVKDDESTPGSSITAGKDSRRRIAVRSTIRHGPDSGPGQVQKTSHESAGAIVLLFSCSIAALAAPQESDAGYSPNPPDGMSQAEQHHHRSSGVCQIGARWFGLHRLPHRWVSKFPHASIPRHARLYRLSQRTDVSGHRL